MAVAQDNLLIVNLQPNSALREAGKFHWCKHNHLYK